MKAFDRRQTWVNVRIELILLMMRMSVVMVVVVAAAVEELERRWSRG